MSVRNPASILFDAYGNAVATLDGYNLSFISPGLPVMGQKEDGSASFFKATDDGYLATKTDITGTGGLATEATLLDAYNRLVELEAKDYATQTTLLDAYNRLVDIEAKDFATETTLSAIEVKVATQATLLDAYNRLVELEAKDYATETTLAALELKVATEATLLDAYNRLVELEAKDFATETTLNDAYQTLLSIKDVDGIKRINDPLPIGDNEIGRVKLVDEFNNFVDTKDGYTITSVQPGIPIIGVTDDNTATFLNASDDGYLVIKVSDGYNILDVAGENVSTIGLAGIPVVAKTAADESRFLLVEDSGKLVVASTVPSAPAGTTEFVLGVSESQLEVGAGGDVSSPHTTLGPIIANEDTLFLQLITAGTEGDPSEAGSKVEVYWREGAGPTDHLVERIYIDGETVTLPVPSIKKARDGVTMTGNGTNTRLIVVRTRQSTAAEEIDFVVRGYTE